MNLITASVLLTLLVTQPTTKPIEKETCTEWTRLDVAGVLRGDPRPLSSTTDSQDAVMMGAFVRGYATGMQDGFGFVLKDTALGEDAGKAMEGISARAIASRIDVLCRDAPYETIHVVTFRAAIEAAEQGVKRILEKRKRQ